MPSELPQKLAPFFVLTAAFHAASLATRFDALAAHISLPVQAAILFAQFPLLLVAGYFEGLLDYGPGVGPVWMRIKSRPVKLAFTFAFLYLVTLVLQTWDLQLGPLDPTPPAEWPQGQRAAWFAMFTGGMFFPNYLAASATLIPVVRRVTAPFHALPPMVALGVLSVLGVLSGWGALALIASQTVAKNFDALHALSEAINENPAIALAFALAMAWIPILAGIASQSRHAAPPPAPSRKEAEETDDEDNPEDWAG